MRSNLVELGHKIEMILSDPTTRSRQLIALAESLAYVERGNPEIWLVHVREDRIRLFAGRLIVLTLTRDSVWVTTDDAEEANQLSLLPSWMWDDHGYPRYKQPPSRNGYYSPSRDRDGIDWSEVQGFHFAYLDRVLARFKRVDPRSAARHEPLISEYLSMVLGPSADEAELSLMSHDQSGASAFWEGAVTRVPVNRFERDRRARDQCLLEQGRHCTVCGMSFGKRYGPAVEGLIHVHHIVPLSEIREGYSPNPKLDLVPICANCHAVVHAGGRTRSIDEVRSMLRRQSEQSNKGFERKADSLE